jgi:clan AA aspartic protease (TIGR02281 family)
MKRKFIACFLLCTVLCYSQNQQNSSASKIITQDKYLRASEVVGYFSGIEISLDLIINKNPDLNYDVNKLRLLYNKNFSASKINALKFLNHNTASEKFEENLKKTLDDLKFEIGAQIQNYQKSDIENYLKQTEVKLNGEIERQFLENILSFQYVEYPSDEFGRGYIKTYNTTKHKKAKNSEWSLKIPISWKSSEANGENIIQKFVDDCGQGFNMITIINQDIPGLDLKNSDIQKTFSNEFFTKENILNFLPEDASFLSFKTIRIANSLGCVLTYEVIADKMGINIKSRNYQYIFQNGQYLFFINCSMSTDDVNENLEIKEKKLLPLFQMILNSVSISSKSESIIYLYGEANQKKLVVEIANQKYDFILDTGASISVINKNILAELALKKFDIQFIREGLVKLADGKNAKVEYWKISTLKVGAITLNNVLFSVIDSKDSPLLLGMDFLNLLDIWKIDLENNKIFLRN